MHKAIIGARRGTHTALWLVLAVGLVVRLALLAGSATTPLQIMDEQHYAQLATNLVQGNGFAWGPDRPTSMRPPLYPAFVAAVWAFSGEGDYQAVRAAQVVIGLLTIAAVYVLALRLFDRRAATAAAAIVALYPSFVFSGALILSESLFTLLIVLLALAYRALVDRQALGYAVAAGVFLGLSALTRSVLWPFVVVLPGLVFLGVRGSTPRRVAAAACCVLGYVMVVGPWTARNVRLQHTFSVIDTQGGMNLMMGNYANTPERRMWDAVALLAGDKSFSRGLGASHPESATWTDGQKEKWAQGEAINYMVAHPGTTLRRSVLKFIDFWGMERELIAGIQSGLYNPPGWIALLAIVSVLISYPVVVLSAIAGAFRQRPADWRTHALLVTIILFVTAIHSVVFGHSRYHLPLVAFLAVYAGAFWTQATWRQMASQPRLMAAPAAVAAVLVAGWCYEVLVRDADRIRMLLQAMA